MECGKSQMTRKEGGIRARVCSGRRSFYSTREGGGDGYFKLPFRGLFHLPSWPSGGFISTCVCTPTWTKAQAESHFEEFTGRPNRQFYQENWVTDFKHFSWRWEWQCLTCPCLHFLIIITYKEYFFFPIFIEGIHFKHYIYLKFLSWQPHQ